MNQNEPMFKPNEDVKIPSMSDDIYTVRFGMPSAPGFYLVYKKSDLYNTECVFTVVNGNKIVPIDRDNKE